MWDVTPTAGPPQTTDAAESLGDVPIHRSAHAWMGLPAPSAGERPRSLLRDQDCKQRQEAVLFSP